MKKCLLCPLLVIFTMSFFLGTGVSRGEEASPPRNLEIIRVADGKFLYKANYQDADLSLMIADVSRATGRNIVVPSTVKGKVTLITQKPLNSHELWQTFLSVLSLNGYTAVEEKHVVKVLPRTSENASFD
jgi:type II secretory pathway component GspD/PulD (secretin)